MNPLACAAICTASLSSGLLSIMLASPLASAAVAFKCTARDGAVSFQDRPCAVNEHAETLQLAEDPPLQTAGNVAPAMPPADAPAKAVASLPTPPQRSPPTGFLCTRDDGSRYLSDTGIAQRRAVPLAMLGVPSLGLADAYGAGGAGISAPGVRATSGNRLLHGSLGAAYVWIEDTCARASGEQICEFLSREIDQSERTLRLAFSDTTAQVKAEIAALRARAIDCEQ